MVNIEEGIDVLKLLGLPKAQLNNRSSLTLLTLLNLKKDDEWINAEKNTIRIHDVLSFVKENYGVIYAENTRETIRRQTIHQFEQAGLVIKNHDDPLRPTNSPKTNYIISDEALETIRKFNTDGWEDAIKEFKKNNSTLIEIYGNRIEENKLDFNLDGINIVFSPGKHNELQIEILTIFRSEFCKNTHVVYVGDTADKFLYMNKEITSKLGIPLTKHDRLPDILLYDEKLNILFLIEAVTSHGPLSPKRIIELEDTFKNSNVKKIFITAFPDFSEFKKHAVDISWDTEIWISDNPNHMIHFNGHNFFTIYE